MAHKSLSFSNLRVPVFWRHVAGQKIGKCVPAIQQRPSDRASALYLGLRYSKTQLFEANLSKVYTAVTGG